jgi:oxaloacetate decarboxylase alpha subunit/pyruvate carboxylase subunit B
MKPVTFNNTVLRDGHQSLAATRMKTDQMLPAAPVLDGMGFSGLETWGGATIDSCLRYLAENPFERISKLKAVAPQTPHLMLLRGQNIVQYTSFPDDVVEAFVRCTANRGMDVFRIFDALNDTRNLETSIRAVKECGKHARGEICYTISPVHTQEAFLEMGRRLRELGCDSLAIKDMAGLIKPRVAYDLIRALREQVGLPVTLHSHDTAGLAAPSYMAAVDAGVDAVETSIVPFANGTGQPDTARMLAILEGHERCPWYDPAKLAEMRAYFETVYVQLGKFTSPANERTDADTLEFQIPGGMLSNFRNQLKEQGMADRWDEVAREIPYVRGALGWIPLVTPTSQIVGTQAMLNVKFGRWKMFSQPAMDIALNKYGQTPGPIDPEVRALAEKNTGQSPIEERPANRLEPRMEKLRAELRAKEMPDDDEMCVLHAMFPVELEKLIKPAPTPAPAPAVEAAPAQPAAAAPVAAPVAAAPVSASGTLAAGPAQRMVMTVDGKSRLVIIEELLS